MKILSLMLGLVFLFKGQVIAQTRVVPIGQAEKAIEGVYVSSPDIGKGVSTSDKKAFVQLTQVVRDDFNFYNLDFKVFNQSSFLDRHVERKMWKKLVKKGVKFVLLFSLSRNKSGLLMKVKSFDLTKENEIFTASGVFKPKMYRAHAHLAAGEIFKKITGRTAIFKSKIVFVSDKNSTANKVIKEIYEADFDGKNIRQLTRHNGIVISPAYSFDGSKILYSLIREIDRKRRNITLYLMDIKTRKSLMISSRPGINSGAVFVPGDKEILLTLSHRGNADIYRMNLKTKKIKQITTNFSIDVDPEMSREGTRMSMLSGRSGSAMIYLLDPNGREKDVKRISFVGQFNATPRFSPDGKTLVFSSWIDNKFDLVRINVDGRGLYRLTRNFGSNEGPSFSPDGQFIVFSSQKVISRKKAVQNLYVIDKDGEIIRPLLTGFGNCISPRWSKSL